MTQEQQPDSRRDVSRRGVLKGATLGGLALPLVAACGGGGDPGSTSGSGATTGGGSAGGGGSSGGGGGGAKLTVAGADIPVGSGKIYADQGVVVTQPSAGDFKAFTVTCTHQGCPVNDISGEDIVCPCHGSRFSIKDGSVVSGPATSPLPEFTATVKGKDVVVS